MPVPAGRAAGPPGERAFGGQLRVRLRRPQHATTRSAPTALRKAVKVLKDEGLVETVTGMGVYVVDRRATGSADTG
ncbi:hypothetical protein [Streptomyces sp. NPDC057438]|uniref:hypothetical protein n=1 Tax=Streptomyces sp. NPDC057438 TaxID=3346133 RepID=UPI0036C708D8